MNAAQKKLKSGAGATILMALLFFLVAVMVSTVIISAAITATQTLRSRREAQQAYLTCSSAAQYIRDALLEEPGYRVEFKQWQGSGTREEKNVNQDRQAQDIVSLVDTLFKEQMGGPTSQGLFTDLLPSTKTILLQVEECDPVQVTLTLKRTDPQTTPRVYLLTADCRVGEKEASCRMVLQMYCTVTEKTVQFSEAGRDYNQRKIYQAVWQKDNTAITRGEGEGTT